MTSLRIDPYQMPEGLSLPEQKWWEAMAHTARQHKLKGLTLEVAADRSQRQAQHARNDFVRLRDEYRQRHSNKEQWAVDYVFMRLGVAQECIGDDQWFSRQATEKYMGAKEHYQTAANIMGELEAFLRRRTAETLVRRPAPYPRGRS